jgi:hypothetical protein
MNAEQLKRVEIISNLSFVPPEKLDEINNFIQFILNKSKAKRKRPISVRGIWQNLGFENIDIEKELKDMRKEIQTHLENKEL